MNAPLRITLIYVAAGVLWIAVSDWLLLEVSPGYLHIGQAAKGVLFVMLSGALIYALVRRALMRRRALEEERERLQLRLAGNQRLEAIGRLTGGIAHDFNNLLTAISGNLESYLDRMAESPTPPSDLTELIEAESAARRAEELTRQLLAVGRRQTLHPETLDLNAVIGELGQLFQRLIGDRIDIDIELQPEPWLVTVDRGPLQQVVMNLALNARDAMPHGGRIALRTTNISVGIEEAEEDFDFPVVPGDYVRLQVTDTGTGMDAETQARIYEPFFTTKEKHVGTGLGLSTVFGIMKQSGGYIDLESAPGVGTTFDLYFPRAQEGMTVEEPKEAEVDRAEPAENPGGETILVAEDEDAVRSIITRSLERRGYHVLAVAGGPEAIAVLERTPATPVDLLLTDAIMPTMTGTELIRQARSIRPGLPVLLMSGYPQESFDSDEPYLAKPFTPNELVARVQAVLSRQRKDG